MIIKDSRFKLEPLSHYLDVYLDNEADKDVLVEVMKKFIPDLEAAQEEINDITIALQELIDGKALDSDGNPIKHREDTISWSYPPGAWQT